MLVNDPYDKIQPAIFLGEGGHYINIIRIKPGTPVRTALAKIESVYKKFNPASPFLYHFNDEDYERKFLSETQIGNLATVFSGLAILISCLGLFGLASFVAEQRTKEIGVRKVLGARVVNLWALLSGDFLKLVMLSCFVSMPLSYFFMNKWLQNYKFHTSLSLWIFVATGAGMLSITLATVSYQATQSSPDESRQQSSLGMNPSYASPAESRVSREKEGLAKKVSAPNDLNFGYSKKQLNEKSDLRNQHDPGWLLRPYQIRSR